MMFSRKCMDEVETACAVLLIPRCGPHCGLAQILKKSFSTRMKHQLWLGAAGQLQLDEFVVYPLVELVRVLCWHWKLSPIGVVNDPC